MWGSGESEKSDAPLLLLHFFLLQLAVRGCRKKRRWIVESNLQMLAHRLCVCVYIYIRTRYTRIIYIIYTAPARKWKLSCERRWSFLTTRWRDFRCCCCCFPRQKLLCERADFFLFFEYVHNGEHLKRIHTLESLLYFVHIIPTVSQLARIHIYIQRPLFSDFKTARN